MVFFKPTIAMNVYSQVKATAVLDPCAGWGGRLLGAVAMGLKYVGIDTNVALKPAYDEMMTTLGITSTMLWQDALSVDFSAIDYDCVLTSPPYVNLEIYEGMTPFQSDFAFYRTSLSRFWTSAEQAFAVGARSASTSRPRCMRLC